MHINICLCNLPAVFCCYFSFSLSLTRPQGHDVWDKKTGFFKRQIGSKVSFSSVSLQRTKIWIRCVRLTPACLSSFYIHSGGSLGVFKRQPLLLFVRIKAEDRSPLQVIFCGGIAGLWWYNSPGNGEDPSHNSITYHRAPEPIFIPIHLYLLELGFKEPDKLNSSRAR